MSTTSLLSLSSQELNQRGIQEAEQGHLGAARGFFEFAHRSHPFQTDIRQNLELAREQLSSQLGTSQLSPGLAPWKTPFDSSLTSLALLFLLSIFLILLGWRIYKEKIFNSITAVLGGCFILLLGCLFLNRSVLNMPPAYLVQKASIFSGPSVDFFELGTLEEGIEVRILSNFQNLPNLDDSKKDWLKIQYCYQSSFNHKPCLGWIQKSKLLTFQ